MGILGRDMSAVRPKLSQNSLFRSGINLCENEDRRVSIIAFKKNKMMELVCSLRVITTEVLHINQRMTRAITVKIFLSFLY